MNYAAICAKEAKLILQVHHSVNSVTSMCTNGEFCSCLISVYEVILVKFPHYYF